MEDWIFTDERCTMSVILDMAFWVLVTRIVVIKADCV